MTSSDYFACFACFACSDCEAEERRRVWGVSMAATHLVVAAPLFRYCYPGSFDAFFGEAAVVVACMAGLSALSSSHVSAALMCLKLVADSALLFQLTVFDPRWSSSPWALGLHVLWLAFGLSSLAFFRIPSLAAYASGAFVLVSSFIALIISSAGWSEFRTVDCAPLALPLAQILLLCFAADTCSLDARSLENRLGATGKKIDTAVDIQDGRLGAPVRAGSIRPAGVEVRLFNDDYFVKLRRKLAVPDTFLNDDLCFERDLHAGSGKGGFAMAFLKDAFIVKEISEEDHKALLDVSRSYCEHVNGGPSRLCLVLLHFCDLRTSKKYFAMRNESGDTSTLKDLYDLKGCADDRTIIKNRQPITPVRKRIWNVHMWGGQCCWTPERSIYKDGKVAASRLKLGLSASQRVEVLAALRRDTDWLAREGLMDYSLIVGVRNAPAGALGPPKLGRQTIINLEADGTETSFDFGIIDFLQTWTKNKVVAQHIKCLETNKATIPPTPYASRFYVHFSRVFTAIN